jgi:hemerythrin-like domain-containing protein
MDLGMDARARMASPADPLLPTPGAGFEQPFEMLQACHERVQRMLRLLSRLREHLPAHGADEQAQQAARDVMRYFDQAAPEHHRDEELHVFPALLAQENPEIVAVVKRLQHDHLQMEARWAAARQVLAGIAAGNLDSLPPQAQSALDAFAGLYGGHIDAEEQIAYPAAAVLLQGAPLAEMSRDMMARRGLR